MVWSHWRVKDGVEGLELVQSLSGVAKDFKWKDVDIWLITQIQISQGILGIFLRDCVASHWDYKPTLRSFCGVPSRTDHIPTQKLNAR